MNNYESVIILKPNLTEDELNKSINDYKEKLEEFSDKPVKVDNLGKKRLAYEIQGNKEGNYAVFYFSGNAENIRDLERHYRIDDNVMKFMTITIEKEFEESNEEDEEDER